jgi:16S rRNA pseudouridine516 synthase
MKSKRSRLDRFLSKHLSINRKDVRLLLAQGRVRVDDQEANDIQLLVDEYTHVQCDGQTLQANIPSYIQLNKPEGVVSATKDAKHSTVIDLLPEGYPENLHIVGRLDFNSTGLLLLTNDGRWSRRLSEPESHIKKCYWVGLDKPITQRVIDAFIEGIYFVFEDLTTRPVQLSVIEEPSIINSGTLIGSQYVSVTMEQGRYHQIKRMFGHFQIEVLALQRVSVGNLVLDEGLAVGESRQLIKQEVSDIFL